MTPPLILVDENIPEAEKYFGAIGEVRRFAGRHLNSEQLGQAKALIVRSVTQVTSSLLRGSQVEFVGTCTIGTDHVDQAWLQAQNIGFASAPGCNANSVAEYILAALALSKVNWQAATIGIVGCGNVGGRVYQKLSMLGAEVCGYDPLIEPDRFANMVSLETALACDVVCMHTPLTREGGYPTHHLLTTKQLAQLKQGAMLINAGRGAVIHNGHLLDIAKARPDLNIVLDVWEFEPWVCRDLLAQVVIGTPHIAGYSWDGKVTGTKMICAALNKQWGGSSKASESTLLTRAISDPILPLSDKDWAQVRGEILMAYDIAGDDARLRAMVLSAKTDDQVKLGFDELRRHYPERREFAFQKPIARQLSASARATLGALGFQFSDSVI